MSSKSQRNAMINRLLFLIILFLVSACSRSRYNFYSPPVSMQYAQQVKYNNKVDILFMVDNSSSMLKYQQKLSAEVPAFVDVLSELKLDYHIAVISSDMGNNGSGGRFLGNPLVIDSASISPTEISSLLSERILLGENGSTLERGLSSINQVLSVEYLTNEGQDFLRDDALLVIVVLSDEDDQSEGLVLDYSQNLNQLKKPFEDGTKSWLLNFIGVTSLDSTCKGYNGYVDPGDRYMELASESNGVIEDICKANLADAARNIRLRIVEILTDFHLDRAPIKETIKVLVNGIEILEDAENGWTYVEDQKLIRFHGTAVPSADASISIDFKPAETK